MECQGLGVLLESAETETGGWSVTLAIEAACLGSERGEMGELWELLIRADHGDDAPAGRVECVSLMCGNQRPSCSGRTQSGRRLAEPARGMIEV